MSHRDNHLHLICFKIVSLTCFINIVVYSVHFVRLNLVRSTQCNSWLVRVVCVEAWSDWSSDWSSGWWWPCPSEGSRILIHLNCIYTPLINDISIGLWRVNINVLDYILYGLDRLLYNVSIDGLTLFIPDVAPVENNLTVSYGLRK
jgi:hypothetical protein